MTRVLVTGAGVISGLAQDFPEFSRALFAGESAVREHAMRVPVDDRTESFWASKLPDDYRCRTAPSSLLPMMDRLTHFACDAAQEAIAQSRLMSRDAALRGRGVIVCGLGLAGQTSTAEMYEAMFLRGQRRANPYNVPRFMPSAPNSVIAIANGLQAPGFSVSSACASSNHALGLALMLLRSGQYDWAVVGGAEAGLAYCCLQSWRSLKVASKSVSAPFSEGPTGMAIGEGAAMFVLETQAHAERAGVAGLAELAGFGMTSDGVHMTQMDPASAATAMRLALDDARIAPADVDHINAHGTGTVMNDRTEAEAIGAVYGARAAEVPVTATKPAHGHAIGATSALEFAACIASLQSQRIPPTLNFTQLREGIHLDVVHGAPRSARLSTVVSHAFGFGGLNAVVVLREAQGLRH